jgi:hypothetical protein
MIFSPELPADTIPLVGTFAGSSVATNQEKAQPAVSEVPQGLSDEELVAHIADCHLLMQLAKARWRGSKSSQDANEWFVWAQAKRNAIEARQAVYRERMADESTFQGEWTQEVLARAGAYFDVSPAAVRRRMG